jgi:hypothetical protein
VIAFRVPDDSLIPARAHRHEDTKSLHVFVVSLFLPAARHAAAERDIDDTKNRRRA